MYSHVCGLLYESGDRLQGTIYVSKLAAQNNMRKTINPFVWAHICIAGYFWHYNVYVWDLNRVYLNTTCALLQRIRRRTTVPTISVQKLTLTCRFLWRGFVHLQNQIALDSLLTSTMWTDSSSTSHDSVCRMCFLYFCPMIGHSSIWITKAICLSCPSCVWRYV